MNTIDYHWLSLIIINYHWLSLITINYHWLSLTHPLTTWNQEMIKVFTSGRNYFYWSVSPQKVKGIRRNWVRRVKIWHKSQNIPKCQIWFKTLPKAQRTRGLSSSCQSYIASSNTDLDQISSSESWLSINKTSASPLNLKFKIFTQPGFRISTKIQLHNLCKTSAAKLNKLQLQNLAWTSTSKSWPTLVLKVWTII